MSHDEVADGRPVLFRNATVLTMDDVGHGAHGQPDTANREPETGNGQPATGRGIGSPGSTAAPVDDPHAGQLPMGGPRLTGAGGVGGANENLRSRPWAFPTLCRAVRWASGDGRTPLAVHSPFG